VALAEKWRSASPGLRLTKAGWEASESPELELRAPEERSVAAAAASWSMAAATPGVQFSGHAGERWKESCWSAGRAEGPSSSTATASEATPTAVTNVGGTVDGVRRGTLADGTGSLWETTAGRTTATRSAIGEPNAARSAWGIKLPGF
jgi:hypothetical protein